MHTGASEGRSDSGASSHNIQRLWETNIPSGGYQVVEPIVINTGGFQMGCDFDGRRE